MDSQEKTLETGAQEELQNQAAAPVDENVVENAPLSQAEEDSNVSEESVAEETAAPAAEEAAGEPERKVYNTKKEVLDRVKEIAHGDEPLQKEEIDYLKTVFYKLHIAEREAQFKAFTDAGNDAANYGLAAGMEGNQERACREGQRAMA